jgi:hypothetical protein
LILLLAWLSSAAPAPGDDAATAAPTAPEPVVWMAPPSVERRIRQADGLRTAGAITAVAGPPLALGGLTVALNCVFGDCGAGTQAAGAGAGILGASATAAGLPLLYGSGALSARLARGDGRRAPGRTLRLIGLGCAGLGILGVAADPNSGAGLVVGAAGYAGSVGFAWGAANRDLRAARRNVGAMAVDRAPAEWFATVTAVE